jgi:histidinol-phosphate aminotransferase
VKGAAVDQPTLTPYSVPRPSVPIDLWLDANECQAPAIDVVEALRAAGDRALCRYPNARPLESLLAERLGLSPEQVLVTPGADEALDRVCRMHLAPGKELLLHRPTFEMLGRYARLAGGSIVSVDWATGPFPTDALIARVTPATTLVIVVSPNNPTGAVVTARDLERIAAAAPEATLLVDLAYTEFADEDLTAGVLALPKALVTRTLSKAWGLAGLRVGYVGGPRALIDTLRATGSPFGVSAPSLVLGEAWLRHGDTFMRSLVGRIREERERLAELLSELGASPLPSQGNFVLARFADAEGTRDALAARGISVRIFTGRPELDGYLRITCPGSPAGFDRLTGALREALAPRHP